MSSGVTVGKAGGGQGSGAGAGGQGPGGQAGGQGAGQGAGGGRGPGSGSGGTPVVGGGGRADGVPTVAKGTGGRGVRPIPPNSAPSRQTIAKPSTARSPLPGVRVNDSGEGEGETLLQRAKRKASMPAAEPGDVAGAGVEAGAQDTVAAGEQTPQEAISDGVQAEGDGQFSFAGKNYPNRAAAENALRSMEGRASAAENRVKKMLETNRGWEQAYNQLLKRQEGGNPNPNPNPNPQPKPDGQPQPQPQPGQEGAEKPWIDAVAMETPQFWDHTKQVFETQGPDVGMAYVISHYDKAIRKHVQTAVDGVMQQLAPILEPIYTERVKTIQQTKAAELWADFSTYKNDVGEGADHSPLFPEIVNNPQAQKEVSYFWLQLGEHFGRDFAFSPYGMHRAYSDWAAWKKSKSDAVSGAANTASQVVQRLEQERSQSAQMIPAGAPQPNPSEAPNHDDESSLRRAIAAAPVGGRGRTTKTGMSLGFRD
jgi:hypothetical protein